MEPPVPPPVVAAQVPVSAGSNVKTTVFSPIVVDAGVTVTPELLAQPVV